MNPFSYAILYRKNPFIKRDFLSQLYWDYFIQQFETYNIQDILHMTTVNGIISFDDYSRFAPNSPLLVVVSSISHINRIKNIGRVFLVCLFSSLFSWTILEVFFNIAISKSDKKSRSHKKGNKVKIRLVSLFNIFRDNVQQESMISLNNSLELLALYRRLG